MANLIPTVLFMTLQISFKILGSFQVLKNVFTKTGSTTVKAFDKQTAVGPENVSLKGFGRIKVFFSNVLAKARCRTVNKTAMGQNTISLKYFGSIDLRPGLLKCDSGFGLKIGLPFQDATDGPVEGPPSSPETHIKDDGDSQMDPNSTVVPEPPTSEEEEEEEETSMELD
ncbi:Hypothetical predicted protein [Xyrichtys novacula]|uniref:Uncharacterized protein n=1 Tax=Xyrichtys novacula TaxID=13765 RepID=A0AAV1H072_XYRNO|nr:Hypothetical predicted protein [Xyrichtys novacula]